MPLADILSDFTRDDQAGIDVRARDIVQASRSIRQFRRDMGLTQAELAKALVVSQAYVAKVERGDPGDMQVATIARIVTAMGGKPKMMVSLPGRPDVMLDVTAGQRRAAGGPKGARVSRAAS